MTSADHNRFLVPAWGLSLLLHGIVVVLALMFVGQVKPILQTETFTWDVALVEPVTPEAISEISEPVAPPVQPPVRAASPRLTEPMPDTTVNRVAPRRSAEMVHPKIEQPKPIEQKGDEPPRLEPIQRPAEAPPQRIEPIEQTTVEAPKPKPEPMAEAREAEPVVDNEPMVAQSEPVQHSAPAEAAELPAPQAPISPPPAVEPMREGHNEEETRPSPAAASTPAAPSAPPVSPSEAPAQVADGKADHRWVGESLWRRVAELKRYPHSARLNGQEGKVILKAVIRSDGQLAEVTVLKSSGHHILDSAAIEAVKLACPLHMKQAINKSEIVVSLPIVYSLAN